MTPAALALLREIAAAHPLAVQPVPGDVDARDELAAAGLIFLRSGWARLSPAGQDCAAELGAESYGEDHAWRARIEEAIATGPTPTYRLAAALGLGPNVVRRLCEAMGLRCGPYGWAR